jgi:hypothetical protein
MLACETPVVIFAFYHRGKFCAQGERKFVQELDLQTHVEEGTVLY